MGHRTASGCMLEDPNRGDGGPLSRASLTRDLTPAAQPPPGTAGEQVPEAGAEHDAAVGGEQPSSAPGQADTGAPLGSLRVALPAGLPVGLPVAAGGW